MNSPETPSPSRPASGQTPPAPALLTLDATGLILAASDTAGAFWETTASALIGLPVISLFAIDVVSDEDGWQQAQWEALLAISADRPAPLQARAPASAGLLAITLRIHPSHGAPTAYFAEVRPAAPATPSLRSSPGSTPPVATAPAPVPALASTEPGGPEILAARGALGFFDLEVSTGRTLYSPGWKRLLGYADEAITDRYDEWLRLIHPEDTAAAPDRAGKVTGPGAKNFSSEFRMRHHLGHYAWVQCNGLRLFDAQGSLQRVLGVMLDITERKEHEEQNFANEDRLQRLAHDGRLALFDLDFTTSAQWFSPACGPLLGDETGEVTLKTLLQALPETAADEGLVAFLSAPSPGETFFTLPLTLRSPDGHGHPVVLGGHRQWSRRRELLRVVGFLIPLPPGSGGGPVPPAMLTATFSALGEGVIITDAHARIAYLNPKAGQLTGWPLDEACKFKLGDVFRLVRQEDGKPDDTAVDLVLAVEENPRLYSQHALVSAHGKVPAPIVWTARQGWDAQGKPAGMVVVFRDPQEMSLTPEEIIRANRFESLGQLAGGIAHDFNNLLTTILGGISQAKDNHDSSRLADSESACVAAKSLTRQLLTFSKGASANSSQQVVAVADILHDAVRIAAAGSTAVVSVEVKDGTSPVEVDRGQILQVFQNLIINAVQAMPGPGTGRVTLRARDVTLADGDVPPLPAGAYVQIEAQDNGGGISPANLEKIFDPFFTTKKQGTGLGLATVLAIVRKHGGQIGVDSTLGKGTTFTLFFPQAVRPLEAPVRRAPALRFGTGRVLFMDDDPKICDLTAGMLASLDYTYDIAKNGADALTFYKRYLNIGRPYDAVILDLNVVGGMGGEECFKALRDLHPEVRAIVSSGYDSEEMARRYYDMGFVGYLSKPYRAAELGKAIKTSLGSGS